MKKLLIGLSSLFVLLFTGCSGGGGTSAEANTNVYDLRTFIDIPNYTINGEGTITAPAGTVNVTGSYWSLYNGPGEVNGTHAHEVIMTLTGGDITVEDNFYAETYMGNIFRTYNRLSEINCQTTLILDDITPVPTDAQVGYTSEIVPLECNDGSYVTNVIELNDAGGGNAIFSYTSNTYESQGGALRSSQTANIEVTPTMSMVNAEITGSIPADGITFVLYSTSITQP